ncbi:hypothetical protein B0H19DRAFT_920195, partial [Mycena capillaripes]
MLAQGRCFTCEEVGHLARNCPKTTNVVSRERGKPPGFGLHAARFSNVAESALLESTQVLDTLPIGAIGLMFNAEDSSTDSEMPPLVGVSDSEDEEFLNEATPRPEVVRDNGKKFPKPRRQLGDVMEDAVRLILEVSQPYPGDERVVDKEILQKPRFDVMRVADDCYVVKDEYFLEISILPLEYLRVPAFSLASWYANIRAVECGIEDYGFLRTHCATVKELLAD